MNNSYQSTFQGFARSVGRPGVRNYLLVLNLTGLTERAAQRVAAQLANACLISMPHGVAITGAGEEPVDATLLQLARHANVGAVLALSADRNKAARFAEALSDIGKPLDVLVLDSFHRDIASFCEAAAAIGRDRVLMLSSQRRTPFAMTELSLAVECGMSDPTSGIAANPLVGAFVDRFVGAGGTVIFGETAEWLGLENQLVERSACESVGRRILSAVRRREDAAKAIGLDLTNNNPNKANIDSGLTTIEDKAIGSVSKSGTLPISGVLSYGEPPQEPGLYAMDGPSYTPESLTGLVAADTQMALFTTGLGNSYVSALAPTLKITGNDQTASKLRNQIDFDCSDIITRNARVPDVLGRLDRALTDIASGDLTRGELMGEGNEVVARFGETL